METKLPREHDARKKDEKKSKIITFKMDQERQHLFSFDFRDFQDKQRSITAERYRGL